MTSPEDEGYNCVAWAAGDNRRFWQPVPGYYWPVDIQLMDVLGALILVFEGLGFAVCDGAALEPGYDKVALYGDGGAYTHAARQTDDGGWTSKLGPWEDLGHAALCALEGTEYGRVEVYMHRPRDPSLSGCIPSDCIFGFFRD